MTTTESSSIGDQVRANRQLVGHVAVVTGGASGIGRATVMALAGEGAKIAIVDRDAVGATKVTTEAGLAGAEAHFFAVDLADSSAVTTLVKTILLQFGHIDLLVNAAGITGGFHSSLDFSEQTFNEVFAINVRAAFLLVREVGNHMVKRGGGGRIVNLSSSAGFRAQLSPAVYAASKAAICGLTRAAAADLGPYEINVNAVAPGVTKTPMTAEIGDDEAYTAIVSSGPLENLLHLPSDPEDVAAVILFLCLPGSRQLTGQVIHTSAGLVI